jgi:hypothetical protein
LRGKKKGAKQIFIRLTLLQISAREIEEAKIQRLKFSLVDHQSQSFFEKNI